MSNEAITWALHQKGLKSNPKFILVLFANYADEEFVCYPSIERIMERCGMGRDAVINGIKVLEERKLVAKRARGVFGGGRKSNVYQLCVDESRFSGLMDESRDSGNESRENRTNTSDYTSDTNSTKRKRFQKPTTEQVQTYCQEKDYKIDAERFVDYYETIGWVVGKARTPMKDWKAAVRNWVKTQRSHNENRKRTNSKQERDHLAELADF